MLWLLLLQLGLVCAIQLSQTATTVRPTEEKVPGSKSDTMGSSATPTTAQIMSTAVVDMSISPTLESASRSQSMELSSTMDLPEATSTPSTSPIAVTATESLMEEALVPSSVVIREHVETASSIRTVAPSPTKTTSPTTVQATADATTSTPRPESSSMPSFADFMDNNINFTLNLYKKLSEFEKEEAGNVFFSPLSIFSSLLMLHYGARGRTANEMTDALDMRAISTDPDLVHRMYGSIVDSLSDDPTSQSYVLMANKMFINMAFDVKREYRDGIKSFYNASIEKVDFGEPHTTHLINAWVSHKTNGHIRNLFKSTLSGATSAVLLNALYFRGDWQYEFQPIATDDNAPFFVDSHNTVNVSMMVNKVKLAYAESRELGASILELPYVGDRLSMFVILPNEFNTLAEVEERINLGNLKTLLQSMRRHVINVRLPKFSLRDSPPIVECLMSMGMRRVFTPDADLSGLADGGLTVSDIKHEATIDVSETGSIASAATGVILERLGSSYERHFEADQPFLFFIIDKQNGLILFMGRLQNPPAPA